MPTACRRPHAAAACGGICSTHATNVAMNHRLNIIFIVADDLGFADLGCYGEPRAGLAGAQRLAAHGLRFTPGLRQLRSARRPAAPS